jgi:MFS transporter, PAT family, beta-lactamase induction signal transducer AmpG
VTSRQNPRGRARDWLDALRVYRQPRMAASLALGFSCGLPFILVGQTLSAWLRQSGIERATIGMLSWVALLYTIKFLWAPVVDRLNLPLLCRLLGRRRSWMLLAQLGIAGALVHLAHQQPTISLTAVAVAAILVAFCSATQDIAVDAWRVESAPPQEQGAMAAGYQLGYRIAVMAGTAGAFWVAADFGWRTSYLTMAALVTVGLVATLLAKEPETQESRDALLAETRVVDWLARRAHWPGWLKTLGGTFIGAVICPLTDFFARYGLALGVLLFSFIGSYRLTDYAMGPMANPFYIDHGYTLKEVAAIVKGVGVIASLAGVLIGGVVVARVGVLTALAVGSLMMMVSNLGFAVLASTSGADVLLLGLVNGFDNIAYNVHGTALLAFLASLTNARYTATQYAVLSSLYALPGKLLMGVSGIIADHLGYVLFFLYTAALSIPGLVLLYFVARRHRVAEPLGERAR